MVSPEYFMRLRSTGAGGVSIVLIAALSALVMAAPARAQSAAEIYKQACQSCHGVTGKGDGPAGLALHPHPANLTVVLKDKSDSWIEKVITQGGASAGLPPTMPSFGASLSPDQVKALVGYVRQLGGQGK